ARARPARPDEATYQSRACSRSRNGSHVAASALARYTSNARRRWASNAGGASCTPGRCRRQKWYRRRTRGWFIAAGASLRHEHDHFDPGGRQWGVLRLRRRAGPQAEGRHLARREPAHLLHGVLVLEVLADRLALLARQHPGRGRADGLVRVGVGDDDHVRALVLEAAHPRGQLVEALLALRREHRPPRLEQLRLGEALPVPLAAGPNEQGVRVLDVAAHEGQPLERVGVLLDRRHRVLALPQERDQGRVGLGVPGELAERAVAVADAL